MRVSVLLMLTVVVVVVLLMMMMRMLTTMMLTMTTGLMVKGSKADSVWKEQQTKSCERGVSEAEISRERARIISSCSPVEAEHQQQQWWQSEDGQSPQICSFVVSLRVQNRVRFLCLLFTILLVYSLESAGAHTTLHCYIW